MRPTRGRKWNSAWKIDVCKNRLNFLLWSRWATHSANLVEKVHKPKSKYYSRIGANMELIFTHALWIWLLLSVHHIFLRSDGVQGTHIDALNPFSSKLMTLALTGGLWTFLANLALCEPSRRLVFPSFLLTFFHFFLGKNTYIVCTK